MELTDGVLGVIGPPTRLHLATDEATNVIHAVELTTHSVSDAEMIKPLVADIQWPVAKLSGDGAYDQVKVYDDRTADAVGDPLHTAPNTAPI